MGMKSPAELATLFSKSVASGMMDAARLINLAYWLMQCESIPGDVVEFGSNMGHTAAFLSALSQKQFWCFDSFQGLPAKSCYDITEAKFTEGSMRVARAQLEKTFLDAELLLPTIVPKWFEEVGLHEVPHRISFAVLDGDLYPSIKRSLELVYPHLSTGAVCFIDDYPFTGLPGVKRATDEFMANKPEKLMHFRGPCGALCHQVMFQKK